MCLAIFMYLVTGTLSLVCQVSMALGIFLLKLLGQAILFVCASIYTVAHPNREEPPPPPPPGTTAADEASQPFVTMYPELQDFEDDYEAMTKVSLETVTSTENTSAESTPRRNSKRVGSRRMSNNERIVFKPSIRRNYREFRDRQ